MSELKARKKSALNMKSLSNVNKDVVTAIDMKENSEIKKKKAVPQKKVLNLI